MRFIQQALSAIAIGLLALAAVAASADPVEGTDYRRLEKPQQTEAEKKIEVTEFFWYACPHCFAFDPSLTEWVKKQGDNIVFKRIPIAFRESFVPQQKLYYALEAMGKLDEMHSKVFNAIHTGRQRIDTDAAIADFVASQGIDKAKFLDVYNSFSVQTKVRRALQLQQAYGVDGVPMVAIDGRYVTAPSMVGEKMRGQPEAAMHAATLDVMSFLVAKAAKEHKAQAGGAKAATAASGAAVRK
jgi:thiol:disulfide interchange protein DsbA